MGRSIDMDCCLQEAVAVSLKMNLNTFKIITLREVSWLAWVLLVLLGLLLVILLTWRHLLTWMTLHLRRLRTPHLIAICNWLLSKTLRRRVSLEVTHSCDHVGLFKLSAHLIIVYATGNFVNILRYYL